MHVQRMLKMSRVYTLAEILSKVFVKNEGKLGILFTIMVDKLTLWCQIYFIRILVYHIM